VVAIAILTPVVALVAGWMGRMAARQAGAPISPAMRRNIWILGLAGPVNLALWWLLGAWLDSTGPGSLSGWLTAAAVFIVAGLATGWFARLWKRGRSL
jgi:hypothetical protein